ncbi:MAG: heavy-metal-associated domain-containing protein [Flavobacteriales bacterium]|nr:heavy-metal-associated domain-containing protein [Flavobacteriales bacterium]
MRKKIVQISMITSLLFVGNQLFATTYTTSNDLVSVSDSTTESFKVFGNCGMCKRTIEGSLVNQEGIYSADWNKETKMIRVNYNEFLISLDDIKKKITSVGYDTEVLRATEESYNGLSGCCQYERPEKK